MHSRGSGTEAIMKLMAQKNGITYSNISYVPGSEVRAGALLQGNVKASIVDSANQKLIESKAPGKFAVLPMEGVNATDEALYANTEFLTEQAAAVEILVEELLKTWREINANPAVVAELRKKYNLLADLPADLEARDRAVLRGVGGRPAPSRPTAAASRRSRTTSPSTPWPARSRAIRRR